MERPLWAAPQLFRPIFLEVPGALPARRRRRGHARLAAGVRAGGGLGRVWVSECLSNVFCAEAPGCCCSGAVGAGACVAVDHACTGLLEAGCGGCIAFLRRVPGGGELDSIWQSDCMPTSATETNMSFQHFSGQLLEHKNVQHQDWDIA